MYEFFDHTADLGIRVRAADLDTLFVDAAVALFATIVEDPASVKPETSRLIEISGTDLEYLLFDWLKALLYLHDAEHLLFSRYTVDVGPDGVQGKAFGEVLDRTRHELGHEVKAITYHGLMIERTDEGWLAEVIVDI